MNKRKLYFQLICAITITLLSGCSKSTELLTEIPGDVQAVIKLDIPSIAAEAGCTDDNGELSFSYDITRLLNKYILPPQVELLPELSKFIEEDDLFAFLPSDWSKFWVIAKISDRSGLERYLADKGYHNEVIKPYSVWTFEKSGTWFVTDDILWWTYSEQISQTPESFSNSVKANGNLGDIPGVGDFFRREGPVKLAILNPDKEKEWVCMDIVPKAESLSTEITRINQNGTLSEFKGLKKINTDFLNYIPENPYLIMAAGIGDDVDWNSLSPVIGLVGGFEAYGIYEAILPSLKSIDGTIALAVAPIEGKGFTMSADPTIWQAILLAQMKEGDAKNTIGTIRKYLNRFGFSPNMSSDDYLEIPFDEIKIRISYNGGYLTISNYSVQNTNTAHYKDIFSNTDGAMTIMLSPSDLEEIMDYKTGFGLDFVSKIDKDHVNSTLKLPGSKTPVLEVLINVLAK